MKKFLVLLVVLAITGFASMAFAVDVTVGGSIQVRSRDFNDLNMGKEENAAYAGNTRDTQERVQIDVNAKADNVKGKISIWNDFDDWSRFEQVQANNGNGNSTASTGPHFGIREAWLSFNLPGVPVNVTGGHQLLQLGNGWFFRSKHFGSDAWVVAVPTGNNTLAFVDVKISEGRGTGVNTAPLTVNSNNVAFADDTDAYVLLDVYKLGDMGTVGFDLTQARDRRNTLGLGSVNGNTIGYNLSLSYNGNIGPLALKVEADAQAGTVRNNGTGIDHDLKGKQVVVEGKFKASDALALNFTLGRGTGNKTGDTDINGYLNFLDIDPHYTFLYEYKMPTAAGAKNTGFSNTTAAGIGAMFSASKSLDLGATYWYLTATQSTNVSPALGTAASGGVATNNPIIPGGTSKALGQEIDVMVNWKIYDNLSWNWVIGYFSPGNAYKGFDTVTGNTVGKNAATGIQGILAFSF